MLKRYNDWFMGKGSDSEGSSEDEEIESISYDGPTGAPRIKRRKLSNGRGDKFADEEQEEEEEEERIDFDELLANNSVEINQDILRKTELSKKKERDELKEVWRGYLQELEAQGRKPPQHIVDRLQSLKTRRQQRKTGGTIKSTDLLPATEPVHKEDLFQDKRKKKRFPKPETETEAEAEAEIDPAELIGDDDEDLLDYLNEEDEAPITLDKMKPKKKKKVSSTPAPVAAPAAATGDAPPKKKKRKNKFKPLGKKKNKLAAAAAAAQGTTTQTDAANSKAPEPKAPQKEKKNEASVTGAKDKTTSESSAPLTAPAPKKKKEFIRKKKKAEVIEEPPVSVLKKRKRPE